MENVRNLTNIKFVTTEARRNYLVAKSNYHTTNFFSENLLAIEMKKTLIFKYSWIKVYLGLSISNTSKIVMYEFWYDYVKPKYGEKQNYFTSIQTAL